MKTAECGLPRQHVIIGAKPEKLLHTRGRQLLRNRLILSARLGIENVFDIDKLPLRNLLGDRRSGKYEVILAGLISDRICTDRIGRIGYHQHLRSE